MSAVAILPADWAARISAAWQSSVRGILETGQLIVEAKAALPHGEFTAMIEGALPFGARTAQRLMAIAADERLANPTHVSHLPASWGTLYELTKLSDDQFEVGIKTGAIRPDIERSEVVSGARSIMASRQEPDESLDFSPTPPFATRALFEHVFPHLGVSRVDQVWEPACGEGHMTAVIEEYAKGVVGTDIFDYGRDGRMPPAWWRTLDFLDEKEETPVVDWIITNPPFKDGEAFALRAIELTKNAACRGGVALFVRWQWIETVDRYNNLFKPYPPTLVCPFVERVPLHMGRWEPDGSTATAYCFVIWMPWRVPPGPTELFWIPPGCRSGLTRPDDRERFTAHPVMARKSTVSPVPKPAVDIPALTAALAGLKLSLNERLHARAMAARLADGVASPERDERYLVDIARKYGVDVVPPSGLLAPAQRAALASAFSTTNEVKPCP